MSYCRFGSGDVYLYHDVGGYLCCCACRFHKETIRGYRAFGNVELKSRTQALQHLHVHRRAGHRVPQYAFERLEREIREIGDRV